MTGPAFIRNDLVKVQRLLESGAIPADQVSVVEARHDLSCPMLRDHKTCLCDPELWLDGRRIDRPAPTSVRQ